MFFILKCYIMFSSSGSSSSAITSSDGMGSIVELLDVDAMSDLSVPLNVLEEDDLPFQSDWMKNDWIDGDSENELLLLLFFPMLFQCWLVTFLFPTFFSMIDIFKKSMQEFQWFKDLFYYYFWSYELRLRFYFFVWVHRMKFFFDHQS